MAALSYADRKLISIETGVCLYPGCTEQHAEDSNYCPMHRDDARARSKRSRKAARAVWKAKKQCIGCGGKRRPGRAHCSKCINRMGRAPHYGVNNSVDKSSRISVDAEGDGYSRSRYHGRARRGAMSKVETVRQGLEEAAKSIAKALDGVTEYETEHVQSLPRIQREAVLDAAVSHADHAERFLDEVRELVREKRKRVG